MRASEYRSWFEARCIEHRVTWTYTATRDWWARPGRRDVSVPPPIDSAALAICVHELGHVLVGPCPRTENHFRTRRGCVCCEFLAWQAGRALLPASFDVAMVERMRAALGTYLRTPAPYAALQQARGMRGNVQALAEKMARIKWQSKKDELARLARRR